ncbi:stalk domain-containing protein [Chengkuizengella axinellae]|uniref:Stalk domain-containing protein n=1 Tax=Chengkuizengella axinellae TaxID=3064388 RepID=A0ABT9IU55_9BACL|nr:stalk domain-containing protein [Chengkuizengella sp. 2205SS18-9]MDP5272853.1 stalk domain-containing protein [Chengkuizengella sp. 2205SS18-9]
MKRKISFILSFLLLSIFCISIGIHAETQYEKIEAYLNKSITFVIDEKTWVPIFDGKEVYPITYNNTTYLPLRSVSEELDVNIRWVNETDEIQLNTTRERPDKILTKEEVEILLNSVEKPELLSLELLHSEEKDRIIKWFAKLDRWKFEIFKPLHPIDYSNIDLDAKDSIISVLNQYYTKKIAEEIFNSRYKREDNYYWAPPSHTIIELELLTTNLEVELLSGTYYYDLFISGISTEPDYEFSEKRSYTIDKNFLIHDVIRF